MRTRTRVFRTSGARRSLRRHSALQSERVRIGLTFGAAAGLTPDAARPARPATAHTGDRAAYVPALRDLASCRAGARLVSGGVRAPRPLGSGQRGLELRRASRRGARAVAAKERTRDPPRHIRRQEAGPQHSREIAAAAEHGGEHPGRAERPAPEKESAEEDAERNRPSGDPARLGTEDPRG